jgi:hypothetical protein
MEKSKKSIIPFTYAGVSIATKTVKYGDVHIAIVTVRYVGV